MQTNSNTVKRSAYFCMCGTGLFMIVSKLLSFVLSDVYYKAAAENFDRTEIVLTNIIRALFGANTGVSIAAARSVLGSGIPDSFFAMFTTLVTLVIPAYVFSKLSGRGISDGCWQDRKYPGISEPGSRENKGRFFHRDDKRGD